MVTNIKTNKKCFQKLKASFVRNE